jgi:hypothetical protein
MTDSNILTSGYNELYNEIYCGIFPNDNGYKLCSNCNFGQQEVWDTVTASGERDCQNQCTNDSRCTSFSFNTTQRNKNCTKYRSFPNQIVKNVPNINSGYSITKFGFNYKDLSPSEKKNIQKRCANQYINNTFLPNNKNLSLSNCLSIDNSQNPTKLNINPQCVYNTFTQNKLPVNIINNTSYISTIDGNPINNQTDSIIDQQYNLYTSYNTSKDNNVNLNSKLMGIIGQNFSEIDQNVTINNSNLYNNFKNTLTNNSMINNSNTMISSALGIQENFENHNKKNNFMFIILIVFLILFLFYVFKKK